MDFSSQAVGLAAVKLKHLVYSGRLELHVADAKALPLPVIYSFVPT